jgi:hypothetical protein
MSFPTSRRQLAEDEPLPAYLQRAFAISETPETEIEPWAEPAMAMGPSGHDFRSNLESIFDSAWMEKGNNMPYSESPEDTWGRKLLSFGEMA